MRVTGSGVGQARAKWALSVSLLTISAAVYPGGGAQAQSTDRQEAASADTLGTLKVQGVRSRADTGRPATPEGIEAVYRQPTSSVHISRDQIEALPPLSVGDVLRGQPGIQLGDGRNGGALDVNIRGIQGQSRVAVTVDGAQQALDVYRGYGGTQQRSYIDPALISRITVNKGAEIGAAYGGSVGGSVQMQTLTADDVLKTGQSFGMRVTGDVWDNGLSPARRSKMAGENLSVRPRTSGDGLFKSDAGAFSLAAALRDDRLDLIAAYAERHQGNYIAGERGHDRYRSFDDYGREQATVAEAYQPGEEVLNSSAYSQSGLLKAVVRPTDDQSLDLTYRLYKAEIAEIMPSDIYRFGTAGIYQYPSGELDMQTATARYSYNPLANPLVNLTAILWRNDTRSNQITGVMGPRTQFFATDRSWTRADNQRIGGDLTNVSSFYTGVGSFDVTLGAAFQHENLEPQGSVIITQNDRNQNRLLRDGKRREYSASVRVDYRPIETLQLWAGGRYSRFESQDRNSEAIAIREPQVGRWISISGKAGYGNLFWQPDANGEYTDATDPRKNNGIVFSDTNNPFEGTRYNDFGARSEHISGPSWADMVVGFDSGPSISHKADGFTPAVGLNWEFQPDSFFYASYTQAYRMPSLFEMSLGTLQASPNSQIKPEKARSIEVGLSTTRANLLRSGDEAAIKLAYFNNEISDYITRYYDPSTFGGMTFSNADSYSTSGLELQARYDNGRVFGDLSATHYFVTETCDAAFAAVLRREANYWSPTENTPDCTKGSYMGSYTNTQNPPEYAVNLNLGVRLFEKRLTLGGRGVYTSGPTETIDEPWQTGATTPQIYYREVALFDAYADWNINETVALKASVQNIGDRYYIDPLAQSFMPSPGRTVRLGLVARF